jgi:hypothetical protein
MNASLHAAVEAIHLEPASFSSGVHGAGASGEQPLPACSDRLR